jgi:hypothetical protein
MTEGRKADSEQPNVEMESMQEGAPPIELRLPTTLQDVYLVQTSVTCPVPNQAYERSSMDCLPAGTYAP